MKKMIKKINLAIIGMMVAGPAMAAGSNDAICKLMEQFADVFSTLRLLAFIGAGFVIAGWAWGWISSGKGVEIKDVKDKGIGMLVGFIVLFSIGAILSAFMAMAGEGGSLGCVGTMW